MTSPLQKAPIGLLELLNLKTLGKQPTGFAEVVSPVVDARDFYGPNLLIASGTGGAIGSLLNLDEVLTLTANLGVRGIGAILTIGAAGGGDVTISVGYENESGFRCPLGAFSWSQVVAGQILHFGLPMRAVWPMGARMYAHAVAGTVAGADHNLQVFGLFEFFGIQQ